MMPFTIPYLLYNLPVIIVTPVILLALFYLLTPFFDPLRDVKGPGLARYTRLWELYKNWEGQLEHVTVSLHQRYGIFTYLR